MIDLIYCSGNNLPLMQAALDAGWQLGVRSDRNSYGLPITFVDVEYRRPNWDRHMRRVAKESPRYATVPDLSESRCDLGEIEVAMQRGNELANWCDIPLLVPKRLDQLRHIPPSVAIAYSIPSTYGGASFGPWSLTGRRVHLLGGSPSTQRRIFRWIRGSATVLSVDGNMAQKVALSKLNFWSERNVWVQAPRGTSFLECWDRSLAAIQRMWLAEFGTEPWAAATSQVSAYETPGN